MTTIHSPLYNPKVEEYDTDFVIVTWAIQGSKLTWRRNFRQLTLTIKPTEVGN